MRSVRAERIKSQHEQQKQQVTELNNKLLEMEKQRERDWLRKTGAVYANLWGHRLR